MYSFLFLLSYCFSFVATIHRECAIAEGVSFISLLWIIEGLKLRFLVSSLSMGY